MKIIYWNIRGLRRPRDQDKLRSLVHQFSPSLVWIAEPKVKCSASFCEKLNLAGMQSMVIHNYSSNNKGNIWLFWNKNITTPQVILVSSQMITVSIGDVLVSGIHAHVKKVQRRFLWSEMEIISDLKKPWIALGDSNAVISQDEKMCGKSPNRASMLDFSTCLDNCELIQAPKTGLQFSWSNCQQGKNKIMCTLDKVVFNQQWLQKYGDWVYKVGLRIVSDHAPLLGGFSNIPKTHNIQKMCIYHPEFLSVVKECWSQHIAGDPAYVFMHKLKVKIKEAEEKFKIAMQHSDNNPFDEEALHNLVTAQNEHATREVQANTLLSYTTSDQAMLDAVPSNAEIKSIIFEMDPESAPGPDSFYGIFYRYCWEIICNDPVAAIQFCWERKFIPKGLNSNFLVLLPKCQ
ncbi:uncharacterized protein LOC113295466 [Papaver somniferum]|uniref:uncharacterized protein LOC113295466 n=1 Tax=Papaver somniferum TaxID=3469 RepID=UPI000E6FC994|nr:uncharacterized protein LOC113295466 [Papaver somniferum]